MHNNKSNVYFSSFKLSVWRLMKVKDLFLWLASADCRVICKVFVRSSSSGCGCWASALVSSFLSDNTALFVTFRSHQKNILAKRLEVKQYNNNNNNNNNNTYKAPYVKLQRRWGQSQSGGIKAGVKKKCFKCRLKPDSQSHSKTFAGSLFQMSGAE